MRLQGAATSGAFIKQSRQPVNGHQMDDCFLRQVRSRVPVHLYMLLGCCAAASASCHTATLRVCLHALVPYMHLHTWNSPLLSPQQGVVRPMSSGSLVAVEASCLPGSLLAVT